MYISIYTYKDLMNYPGGQKEQLLILYSYETVFSYLNQ